MPKIVAIAATRNQGDVIEAFVRHTLTHCNQLIVLEQGSADDTLKILNQLAQDLSLNVISEAPFGSSQADRLNRLLKIAAEDFSADWVVALEPDEFIQGDWEAVGSSFAQQACYQLSSCWYVPQPSDPSGILNPVERIGSCAPSGAALFESMGLIIPGELIRGGRIRFEGTRLVGESAIVVEKPLGLWLGKFALRTAAQVAVSVTSTVLLKLGEGRSHSTIEPGLQRVFGQIKRNYHEFEKAFPMDLLGSTGPLVSEPVLYRGGPICYSGDQPGTNQLMTQLLDLAENLSRYEAWCSEGEVPSNDLFTLALCPGDKSGKSVVLDIGAAKKEALSFAFPVKELIQAGDLHFGISGYRSVVEILRISFEDATGQQIGKPYGPGELDSIIEIQEFGFPIPPQHPVGILISHRPALLRMKNLRGLSQAVRVVFTLKILCKPEEIAGRLLSAETIGGLHQIVTLSSETRVACRKIEREIERTRLELQSASANPILFLWKSLLEKLTRSLSRT